MPKYTIICERPGPTGGFLSSWITVEAPNDDEALSHFFDQRASTPAMRDWEVIEAKLVTD